MIIILEFVPQVCFSAWIPNTTHFSDTFQSNCHQEFYFEKITWHLDLDKHEANLFEYQSAIHDDNVSLWFPVLHFN